MAAYVMGGFIIVWCTGAVVATLLMCQPFEMNWNRSIPGGHCGDDPLFCKRLFSTGSQIGSTQPLCLRLFMMRILFNS